MTPKIGRHEMWQVQVALLCAIGLQLAARHISADLLPGSQYLIILIELFLVLLLGLTTTLSQSRFKSAQRGVAVVFLALLSAANISSLIFILHALIVKGVANGEQLLVSAIAVFVTNVIVYALWYWEIDSPGLTGHRWSKHDKDFQFTQQDLASEFPHWQPKFGDYMYLAITNAINFAPADARPLSGQAKALMSSQSLVSVFTLALVIARSVSVLGN